MENPVSGPFMAPGMPSLAQNEADAIGQVSADALAVEVRDFHQKGLRSRKHRDLTAEKYLLHVDGEGGSQWYDLYYGQLRITSHDPALPIRGRDQTGPQVPRISDDRPSPDQLSGAYPKVERFVDGSEVYGRMCRFLSCSCRVARRSVE